VSSNKRKTHGTRSPMSWPRLIPSWSISSRTCSRGSTPSKRSSRVSISLARVACPRIWRASSWKPGSCKIFHATGPPVLGQVLLFDLASGKQIWPVVKPRDLSFAIPVIHDVRHGPDWWRSDVRDGSAAEARAESERVNAYYRAQAKERSEREEQEDRKRRARAANN
jgi:hypothetical protein